MQLVSQLHGQAAEAASDGELLSQFLQQQGEATFATLVHRHGPMVFHVCRRVLSNEHDVEDAFQATFLALVQTADKLQHRKTVGDWLHGVAHNTALKARAMISRRTIKERSAARSDVVNDNCDLESWQQIIDEEIRRLPYRYRHALIQCDLQQKTRKEAAQALGWKEGTVASSLARGRAVLCKRLRARGIEITVMLLAAKLANDIQATPVPQPLVDAVAHSARRYVTGMEPQAAASMQVISLMKAGVSSFLNHKATVAGTFLIGALAFACWGLMAKEQNEQALVSGDTPLLHNKAEQTQQQNERAPVKARTLIKPVLQKVEPHAPMAVRRSFGGSDYEILSQLSLSDQQWLDFAMLRQTMLDQSQEMYRMSTGRRERGAEINREWNEGLMSLFTPEQYLEYHEYWQQRTLRASR